ncbi:hypothetical protein [Psychroserpens mesophilus]|uniref:hypothetical protein n=1 Tax=Psychroserpens mesophilus TaxID=325473 RepID=UPI003D648A44
MQLHFNQVKDSILDIKLEKRNEIFTFGADNAYPSLVETLISNSVTSKICVDKCAKAIYGKSFGKIGKQIINNDGQTLNEVLRIASREFATHNNVFLHIGYNGELKIKSIKVIPVGQCRIGKDDDTGYSGKIVQYNNWDKKDGRVDTDKFKSYDRFNPIKKVIEAQIEASDGILQYKGQILNIQKDSNSIYSLSDLNPVLEEAITEIAAKKFRSKNIGNGFLNTKLLTVQPFDSAEKRRKFTNKIDDLRGSENTGAVLVLESSNVSDDLDKQIKLDDLTSKTNDETFQYSEAQARTNIALAFGVPLGLIDVSESSLFGNSGELLKQMNLQLWTSKEEERDMIEEMFNKLMFNFVEPITEDLKIISPYATDEKSVDNGTEQILTD